MNRRAEGPGRHCRRADIEDFSTANDVSKSVDKLFNVRAVVPDMSLIEVDIIGRQPPQRGIHRLKYMLAGISSAIGVRLHRITDLGRDHDFVTPYRFQGLPQNFLALAKRVEIAGIEEIDAEREC